MLAEEANQPGLQLWGIVRGALLELIHPLKTKKERPGLRGGGVCPMWGHLLPERVTTGHWWCPHPVPEGQFSALNSD